METKPLLLYDRSRVTTDWRCPRQRFWQYEYAGRGIVNGNTHLELFLGTTLHDGLSGIARGFDIETLAAAARSQVIEHLLSDSVGEIEDTNFASEQAALVEGLLRGFYRLVWPQLIARYPKVLFIEEEMTYTHANGMVFMSKPDLVLTNGEETVYVEYKSTSSKKEGWVNSWDTAVQLHSTVEAIKQSKDVTVDAVIVQGLYKGYESYGKQSSPMCYCYRKAGQPPFSQDQIAYEYKPGLKRFPTWELEGGVAKWVKEMPDNVLMEQFPQSPPIYVKDYLVENFFKQREQREQEILLAGHLLNGCDEEETTRILNAAFPQRFDQCQPAWGKPCSYRQLCHGYVNDPTQAGYEERIPHHILELEKFQLEDSRMESA